MIVKPRIHGQAGLVQNIAHQIGNAPRQGRGRCCRISPQTGPGRAGRNRPGPGRARGGQAWYKGLQIRDRIQSWSLGVETALRFWMLFNIWYFQFIRLIVLA